MTLQPQAYVVSCCSHILIRVWRLSASRAFWVESWIVAAMGQSCPRLTYIRHGLFPTVVIVLQDKAPVQFFVLSAPL